MSADHNARRERIAAPAKRKKRTPAQRVEAVLARAMHDYADYRFENRGWVQFPREHSAFSRARRSILRLLREVARG